MQFSLFGAAVAEPSLADLDGVLLAGGHWVRSGPAARLSIVVADPWRAAALTGAFAERGIADQQGVRDAEFGYAVRTEFDETLVAQALRWTRGANEGPPPGFELTPGGLRLWTIASGRMDQAGYVLVTADDPVHQAAGAQLARLGLAAVSLGNRGGPGLAHHLSPPIAPPGRAARRAPRRGRPGLAGLRRRPQVPNSSSLVMYRPRCMARTDERSDLDRRGAAVASKKGGTKLVIVESPTKAKMIGGFLGAGYVVEASMGHIRDLPRNAADVPAKYKGEAWARLGVDTEHDFEPLYVVSADRKQQVSRLKSLMKDADELYLATDEDREGEAIAWHLVDLLAPKVPVRRMVFHEITPAAIAAAVASPRELDEHLVDAQETRRILDRLYGYEVSPVLWKKVLPRLSAGRVQSVATRMIVERERARMAFHTATYWDVEGTFAPSAPKPGDPATFTASLVSLDDVRIAAGRDFDAATGLAPASVLHLDEAGARGLAARLDGREFTVQGVEEKPYRRRPYPPFMTSTLQQEAGRKFRWSAQTAMRVAQRLYENGFITYMRTDSTNLSETALTAARTQARELYGDAYVPAEPRIYTRKVKNAQEAHEAIRPAGDSFRTPGEVASQLSSDEFRLYELVWQRTLASQMSDAVGTTVSVRLSAVSAADETAVFTTSGRTITFPGFLRAYVEDTDDTSEKDDEEKRLPQLVRGDALDPRGFEAEGHSTNPPARYTEPSLVKAMEELGVGRPSTYASIMQTIQDRGYVWKKGPAMVPSWTAFAVVGLLESYFGRLVDYGFTASVENDLDSIASGSESRVAWLDRFYFGSDDKSEDPARISAQGGLKRLIASRLEEIDARGVNSIPLDDTDVVVRVGRYGPYLQRGEERASLPEDLAPDELTPERVEELLSARPPVTALWAAPPTGVRSRPRPGGTGRTSATVRSRPRCSSRWPSTR